MKTLDDLEPGDQVYCRSRFNSEILSVTRITKTTIICGNRKFRKKHGHEIGGDSWFPASIVILTNELKQKLSQQQKRQRLIRTIENAPINSLTDSTLENICNLIDNEIKKKNDDQSY